MKKIWKYPLKIDDIQFTEMPESGQILCVQMQNYTPHIWVLVDPDEETSPRELEIFGTGNSINDNKDINRRYIGTFQMPSFFVWHLFERRD